MSKNIILWSTRACPFAHRPRIVLKQKKIDAEIKEIDLTNKSLEFTNIYKRATFADLNSDGKVPILQHENNLIAESDLVSWYIAQTFPQGNPLIFKTPIENARLRYFLNDVGSKIPGIYYNFIGYHKKIDKQSEIVDKAEQVFQKLDKSIIGPFALGQLFSLADIMIWPWIDRWVSIQHHIQPKVKPKNWMNISKWINSLQGRQSIRETSGYKDLYIESTRKYFDKNFDK